MSKFQVVNFSGWLLCSFILLQLPCASFCPIISHMCVEKYLEIDSRHLERKVKVTVILPPAYHSAFFFSRYRALYLNDGQDLPALELNATMDRLIREKQIKPFILIAIHANERRLQEYGVAAQADYLGRGGLAGAYTRFVLEELRPYIERHFRVKHGADYNYFAGFSLGGLSAIDIVWNHPGQFCKVGVFSGSFWWRSKGLEAGYNDDTDRIMHAQIRAQKPKPGLKFWLQTGTEDETDDRNNNGVIDSIDDTLDLIAELERKGYQRNRDMTYLEVQGGQHNQGTWKKVMVDFLTWAFAKD
jgi:enterochelin esterase-like enzyme